MIGDIPLEPYYRDDDNALFLADCMDLMAAMPAESVDMVFADPPYFLSGGGISNSGGKMVSVDKGDWDKPLPVEDKHKFNRRWLRRVHRILAPNGTVWVSGSLHNIYSIGLALEQEGFRILNNITWAKTNPPPNLSCRYFTHSTETILWARKNEPKASHTFNYDLMKQMNGGKQMRDVWEGPLTPQSEKKHGKHPTQKPEYLLERIIRASTNEGDRVLDPFVGSGTTCVVANRLDRVYIGCDLSKEYLDIAVARLKDGYESPLIP